MRLIVVASETLLIDWTTDKVKGIPWVHPIWNLLIFLALCLCICVFSSHSLSFSHTHIHNTHVCRMATQDKKYDCLFQVVLVGDGAVGKSCLISRFVHNAFTCKDQITLGAHFESTHINIDGKVIRVLIWDTGIYTQHT